MKKIVLLSAMCVFMTLSANKTMAQVVGTGTTGDCTWTLTGTYRNYTLTISGNGAMEDYNYEEGEPFYPPWDYYSYGIKTLKLRQGITSIGNYAFFGCRGLTSVSIPNSVTSIGDNAFENCDLTSINIGNSVISIGNEAFFGCDLTSVSIPNSVTTIGERAFAWCNLTSVSIPNSVTTIGDEAFAWCSGLTSISVRVSNIAYSSNGGVLFNKNRTTLLCFPAGKTGSYSIPNSVTIIGNGAFCSCSGLTSAIIPNSVTTIGDEAFFWCSDLTSVSIPNSVTTIGDEAFAWCSGLTSITIPNAVTSVSSSAFYYCSNLTSIPVNVSNTAYSSNEGVLFNKNQTSIVCYPAGKTGSYTIPNSVTTIENAAFFGCSGLTSVNIPNSVTTIEDGGFYGCSGLTSVSIPNSVTTIGDGVFYGCSGLISIFVDASNTVYSSNEGVAFNKDQTTLICCPAGKTDSYTIPNSVTSIGEEAFEGCRGLTSVSIPNSVTSIGDYAFKGCSGLTAIKIPNSVTSIGDNAFADCYGLTSVSIPNSVTSIGDYAFKGCSGLTSVTNLSPIPQNIASSVFLGVEKKECTLKVAPSSVSFYKKATGWKDFSPIIGEQTNEK